MENFTVKMWINFCDNPEKILWIKIEKIIAEIDLITNIKLINIGKK